MKSNVLDTLRRRVRYAEGLLNLRPDDALLASFPKSGSTWIRFALANLISQREWQGRAVDFPTLDTTMPELGTSRLGQRWSHASIPRVIKTHRPYMFPFDRLNSIYLARDPRDVMVSFYRYETGKQQPRVSGSFSDFLRHPKFGLRGWFRHARSWAPHHDHRFAYEELKRDPHGQFRRLFDALGVDLDRTTLAAVVEASQASRVREIEKQAGHTRKTMFKPGYTFAGEGASGTWADWFSKQDREYFDLLRARHGGFGYED